MIELEHVSTERIFDEVKNFKEEDLTSKTIYELFKKYDIQDYQRLKDLLNCKKEEFKSISYILRNELYKVELRLKNKNEIDIEPEIFTFSNYQNSNDINIFKSNLAYLIISGILKLENAEVMGYSKEFIEEFLVPYQNQTNNPYNEYFYNEANGRTSIIDEKGFSKVLGYTPHSVLEKIKEKESDNKITSFKIKK